MSTLSEIEAAVAELPQEDFRQLLARLKERDADEWDREIEADAQDGKLEALYERLIVEENDQPKIPPDEVLDDPKFS